MTELRELNERHELEKAKQALEAQVQQKELLLKEVNHRVKNSLQIVSSILQLQVPHTQSTEAADALRSACVGARSSWLTTNCSLGWTSNPRLRKPSSMNTLLEALEKLLIAKGSWASANAFNLMGW